MRCDDTGPDGCQPLALERLRYFTGRHMTARDFQDADAYHRSFRHLHNRVLHGWGTACGLEVECHPRPECRLDRVLVRCGLALDCCGREIVVPCDVVSPPVDWDARPTTAGGKEPDRRFVLVLALGYRETLVEKVPVLYNPDACSTPAMEFGRIREGYALTWHWVRRDDLEKWGWETPENCDPDRDDWKDSGEDPDYDHDHGHRPHGCDDDRKQCCLDPQCPPGHVVVLAVVDVLSREDFPKGRFDRSGRRSVAQAREHLTHICGINWVHGGLMKASALKTLKVRFDRPLLPAEHPKRPGPRGINERTFVVQYGEQRDDRQMEDLDFVEYARAPYLSPDGRTAFYEIRKPATYRSHILHVTLRCDFLLDCRRRPVDGEHLAGTLPSGNGTPGGTFESWFHVVDDDDYDRLTVETDADERGSAQESQS